MPYNQRFVRADLPDALLELAEAYADLQISHEEDCGAESALARLSASLSRLAFQTGIARALEAHAGPQSGGHGGSCIVDLTTSPDRPLH